MIKVVFPAPLGPKTPKISPLLTFRFTPLRASMKGPFAPFMTLSSPPKEVTCPPKPWWKWPLSLLALVGYLLTRLTVSMAYPTAIAASALACLHE
ncbi:MAG: hypothetical protein QXF24_06900 [Thermoproteota archaeon]